MLQPKVKSVRPLQDYEIYIEYENGETRIFDVKPQGNTAQITANRLCTLSACIFSTIRCRKCSKYKKYFCALLLVL